MRNIRKILALFLALFLIAALCGCAASRMDDGLAGTSGSDSVKPADATDFMSYAGPIFPLTLAQAAPALSADREILLDCAPYAEEYGAAVTVTDRYTIQNSSGEACTATVLYPFVSSLSDLEALRPQLSVDGAGTETAIYPGAFPGWFGPARSRNRRSSAGTSAMRKAGPNIRRCCPAVIRPMRSHRNRCPTRPSMSIPLPHPAIQRQARRRLRSQSTQTRNRRRS